MENLMVTLPESYILFHLSASTSSFTKHVHVKKLKFIPHWIEENNKETEFCLYGILHKGLTCI